MNKTTSIISSICGLGVIIGAVYIYNNNNDLPADKPLETTASTTVDRQEVQDYNSSRSNKPSPITENPDSATSTTENDGLDSESNNRQEVQDYNSSRSNKPSPITENPDSDQDASSTKDSLQSE